VILDSSSRVALRRATRVAGLCYIVIIALGVAQAAFVSSRLPALEAPAALVAALATQSLPFRLGVVSDVVLYALVLVLAVALYVVVRAAHPPLALGGLVLRSAEAATGLSATVIGGVGPLLLLSDPITTDPASVVALLAVRESALDVVLVLVGLGGAAFCYLFLLARLVPRALALWGVITYASMVVLGGLGILWPTLPSSITSALFAQGALFELLFGIWLVSKAGDIAARAGPSGVT
jgi:hypothetical protein